MRRLVLPALVLLLLTACGGPFAGGLGDGAPTPLSVPIAGVLATATRGTPGPRATATRAVGTPGTPIPVRPGPPATPGIVGTPGLAATPGIVATPRPATPTASPAAAQGTLLQLFAPYRPGGLAGGLQVEAQVSGYCSAGSAALPGRPDAWRCMANSRVYDPCFAADSPDTTPLACAADPWAGSVTLLALTAPLPHDRANAAAGTTRNPWAVQLANGARCQGLSGTNGTVAGMRVGAACSDGTQIVGDPDRSTGRWRVYILRDGDPSLTTEEIVAAWY